MPQKPPTRHRWFSFVSYPPLCETDCDYDSSKQNLMCCGTAAVWKLDLDSSFDCDCDCDCDYDCDSVCKTDSDSDCEFDACVMTYLANDRRRV